MKIGASFRALSGHGAIYVCMAMFFTACWLIHCRTLLKMDRCHRQFSLLNDKTLRAVALLDWASAHSELAIAYVVLAIACVAFLQIRGRPGWTYWLTAALFCVPCVVYWWPCAYIMANCPRL